MALNNNRRNFLKKATLIAASLGLTPTLLKSETSSSKGIQANCDRTTLDYYGEGPFYTANPPELIDNKLAGSSGKGEKMIIKGRVMNLDCTEHIPNAIIDIWHADDAGAYDNAGYNWRGKTKSDSKGYYSFETIKPGKYLNGNSYRPSHIHFKVTAPGKDTLTTQLYFQGDTDIAGDAAASIDSGSYDASHRIIPLVKNSSDVLVGNWDIILDAKGTSSVNDIHLDKGIIYNISPNPFKERVKIQIGIFKKAKISLTLYNTAGQKVEVIKEGHLSKSKHHLNWTPKTTLSSGYYFINLEINGLQIQSKKVFKI